MPDPEPAVTPDPEDVATSGHERPRGIVARAEHIVSTIPFYVVLLAAYPVLRLYSDNVADVDAIEVVAPLLAVSAAVIVGLVVLTRVWGDARRAGIVVVAVALPFLTFELIALTVAPVWPHEPLVRAYLTTLMIWVAAVASGVFVAVRLRRRLALVTEVLNVVSVTLILLVLMPIVSFAIASGAVTPSSDGGAAEEGTAPAMAAQAPGQGRDIYHFVLDRYGSQKSLEGIGVDNRTFMDWLSQNGFHIAEDARANYERTALSLSATLQMALHDDLARRMGRDNPDLGPLYELIRNNPAGSRLQQLGYRYYHVGSWFHPTTRSDIADHVEEPVFHVSFTSTLLGQTAVKGLSEVATMVTNLSAHGTEEQQAAATETQFQRLASIAQEPGPKYVFAHVLVPHDPYLFLGDGQFDPARATFASQLEYANARLREIIEPLLQRPEDTRPIIILQADEGPYPPRYTADRDGFDWQGASERELVTKFGVLNAMYLPGPEGQRPLPDDITLVNTYPEILGRYFPPGVSRIDDRTFALDGRGPYDLIEVTDRLGAATQRVPD